MILLSHWFSRTVELLRLTRALLRECGIANVPSRCLGFDVLSVQSLSDRPAEG